MGGYTLELLINGRKVGEQKISVRPRAEATANFKTTLEGLRGRVNFTVVLRGVIVNDVQSVFYDVVSPSPEFSLVYPTAVEGRVGDLLTVRIRLRNEGQVCQQPVVSVRTAPHAEVEARYSRGDVKYGEFLDVDLSIKPLLAGRGRLVIDVICGGYTSTVYIDFTVFAKLSLSAVDQVGGSPPARPLLDGREVTGEVWLAGGSYVAEMPPEVRRGDVRWVFEKWSDGVASPSRSVNLTGNLMLQAFYKLQYYIHLRTPWRTVGGGWFDRGSEVEVSTADVEEGDWRHRFRGWSGSGCPVSGKFVVLEPARCEAVYVREYRVVVKLFDRAETYWIEEGEEFSREVWPEVGRGERLMPKGADGCSWSEAGDRIVLSARGPAQCVVRWQREYLVRIETGLSARPLFWEGWLPEGAVIRYVEGGGVAPSGEGLSAAVVEEAGIRYKPVGWACNGVETSPQVVVDAPLKCVGLWQREVRVVVEVYLDGSFKELREFWVAEGDTLELTPSMFAPSGSLLAPVKFTRWEGAPDTAGEKLLLKPEAPLIVKARFYTDYTPLYVVVAAGAAAALLGAVFYLRKKREVGHTRIWAQEPTEEKASEEEKVEESPEKTRTR